MRITKFELEKWYTKYEFSSKYNLSASGIKPFVLKDILPDEGIENLVLSYSNGKGNSKLVKILSEINNVPENNILVTNGAIEGLFLSQMVLLEPKDKVITIKPTYQALYQVAEDSGCQVTEWKLEFSENFRPDLKKLEKLIDSYRPKMLIINFPNNPTGIYLNNNELEYICYLSDKYHCYLLSDEIYKTFSEDNSVKSAFSILPEYAITLGSLSKAYGLPGLRTGWIFANEEIIEKCLNLRHYTTLCNNTIGEELAITALKNSDHLLQHSRKHVHKNFEIVEKKLENWVNKFDIQYIKPDTGVMVFIKFNNCDDTEKMCVDFEKEYSILLLPGNKYGNDYKQFIRLGFGGKTDELIYCLDKFEEFYSK